MLIFLVIFLILMMLYALLVDFYRRSWNQIPEFYPDDKSPNTFISVVIAVRNEERNLDRLIRSLKHQAYPASLFEVIIVDDHSTDGSWNFLQSFDSEPIRIKCIRLADLVTVEGGTVAYKKLAIEKGIQVASGDLIVTTDADCVFDPGWLLHIASFQQRTRARFVAAPVRIETDGRFLSVFQAVDFLTLQGITGAAVFKRFHSMCNGANLAYEKKAFFEVGGFQGVDNIASGDDMLLMYKIYKQYPEQVFYLKSRPAIVTTDATKTWKDFINQRIRWASKATHYQDRKLFWILLLVYFNNLCFLILAIACFWNATWLLYLLFLLVAKIIIEYPFVNSVCVFFNDKQLIRHFAFLQPCHILYTIAAGWLGKFGSFEWKGRQIKNNIAEVNGRAI